MRLISILLVMMLLAGMAAAQGWYPSTPGAIIQTTDAAESTNTSRMKAAVMNEFNSTTHYLLKSTGASSSTFALQPDLARNVIATMNTSTTGSLKLTGTNINGDAITENLTWTAQTGAKSSTKAFKTITRVDGTCTTNTAQFILGTGDLLGLRTTFPATTVVIGTSVNGVLEGTAPAMTYSTTDVSLNTINTNSAPGGYVAKVCLMSF